MSTELIGNTNPDRTRVGWVKFQSGRRAKSNGPASFTVPVKLARLLTENGMDGRLFDVAYDDEGIHFIPLVRAKPAWAD
jgi:hypothetical protein